MSTGIDILLVVSLALVSFFGIFHPVYTQQRVMRMSIDASRRTGNSKATFSKFDEAMHLYDTDPVAFAQQFRRDITLVRITGFVALAALIVFVIARFLV